MVCRVVVVVMMVVVILHPQIVGASQVRIFSSRSPARRRPPRPGAPLCASALVLAVLIAADVLSQRQTTMPRMPTTPSSRRTRCCRMSPEVDGRPRLYCCLSWAKGVSARETAPESGALTSSLGMPGMLWMLWWLLVAAVLLKIVVGADPAQSTGARRHAHRCRSVCSAAEILVSASRGWGADAAAS